jgi:DNA-binding NarL/FixJ family response regulator
MKMTPQKLTCVLVDDEQSNLDILTYFVKQIPHLELKATFDKPIEALTYLLKTPTDLLITDINMPQLSGIELCEKIYIEGSTQVIFISGYADKMMEALQHCVTDYLAKPVSLIRFEKAVQKALFFASIHQKNYDNIPLETLELALNNYGNLSDSEIKVLSLIAEGNSTFTITQVLNNSVKTIDSHRYNIRKKLRLNPDNSLRQVAMYIMERVK